MVTELHSLKNLGNTTVHWLHAVGIHSRQELDRLGPVEAYNRVRSRGIRASKVLLYALQGALLDVHWTELDPHLKQTLVEQAEAQAAGED